MSPPRSTRYQRYVADAAATLQGIAAGSIDGRMLDKPDFVGCFRRARPCKHAHGFTDGLVLCKPQIPNNGGADRHSTILTSG